jgi:hypothetical protein
MTDEPAANSNLAPAKKPRGRPWQPGQSGNPAGRPPDGQSWAGIIREVTEMSPEQVAKLVGGERSDLGRSFLMMPRKVQLKYLLISRVIAALMFEPTQGLLSTIIERVDGKVTDKLDLTTGGDKLQPIVFDYAKLISASPEAGPVPDREPPGEDESHLHGAALGQDHDGGDTGAGGG